MNCKNCKEKIRNTQNYCPNCGGEIVLKRTTTKSLLIHMGREVFGLDNRYLLTLKTLLLNPEIIIREYIDGTRKKYLSPFVFLAIGTTFSMLIFQQFSEEFIRLSNFFQELEFNALHDGASSTNYYETQALKEIAIQENIERKSTLLRYFNIHTFLLIPLYTLIAFWVFRKPYNYSEHLIIACYLRGFLFIINLILFVLGLLIHPSIFYISFIITVIYYCYVYKRLYNYSLFKIILNCFKFFLVLFLLFTGIVLIVYAYMQLFGK